MRAVDPRLLRHARAARTCLFVTVLLGLAVTGLILAQAALLARALATAALGTGATALAGTLLLLLGVVLARAAAAYGGEVAALRAAARVKSQLRRKLIRHALRLAPVSLEGQRPGEIAAQATKGLDGLDPYFARYLPQLVLSVLVPVAVVVTVTAADWISGVVIAATLPLIPLFAALVGLHTKAQTNRQWRLLAQLSGHFLDVVQGLPTLKAFGRAKFQEQVIARVTSEHRSATMATLRIAFLSALVLELSAALATAIVAVETGLRLLSGHMQYQTALLVLLLTPEAYLPLRAVAAQYHASAEGTAAAQSIFAVLDTPVPSRAVRAPAALVDRGARVPDLRAATISLNGVSVAYPGRDCPALDGLDLTISPGELVMLTGPSGAGKTTVLRLLLRFIEPSSGTVQAGGTDLDAVPVEPWRAQIAWVPQHPSLFAASVADNIALGQPGASRAAIEEAAGLAGAASFIEALPHGYDTQLEEQAVRLSAGERQQLALARALLRDVPLLLLDEPTAHLAPAAAAAIDRAIRGPLAGRTIIVATHRDAGLAGASQVITVDGRRRTEPASRQASPVATAVIR
ncbi:thiol reductant ABC exporter subunit CydD [Trebonia kvetii]|uniref:Thiol reductant ABC exporter subunit CydD n=1 Tax=Trebonia kvetii TaxID=2480626 RepID=A0A6P2BNI0_9ACTN|nr:thiol reductant ABC exporter subunit CydD [Trebonia kvetii]TVZ00532.1 thiol reductant ABC exporter subunit CydD [Trebonia kvetii]